MNRRKFLKVIGSGLGAVVVPITVLDVVAKRIPEPVITPDIIAKMSLQNLLNKRTVANLILNNYRD